MMVAGLISTLERKERDLCAELAEGSQCAELAEGSQVWCAVGSALPNDTAEACSLSQAWLGLLAP